MFLRLLITSFFVFNPRPPNIAVIDQELYDFANIIGFAGLTALLFPKIRFNNKNQPCQTDNDCPGIKKCCQMYFEKFCCSPDNYIKIEPNYAFKM